jgi:hypothetical protein
MTSTLGINDLQPRNLESPRVQNLLPEQVASTAKTFVAFLEEYYKFLNTGYLFQNSTVTSAVYSSTSSYSTGSQYTITDVSLILQYNQLVNATFYISSGTGAGQYATIVHNEPGVTFIVSGGTLKVTPDSTSAYIIIVPPAYNEPYSIQSYQMPTNALNTLTSEFDLDQINSYGYLTHLQKLIAPYAPIPTTIKAGDTSPKSVNTRAQLYKKIVKYYYNSRGSNDSVYTFFQLFFNTVAGLIGDLSNTPSSTIAGYVQTWLNGLTTASSQPITIGTASAAVTSWIPYTYTITVNLSQSQFDASYRAMVHPVGFKYYSLFSGVLGGILEISDSRMDDAKLDYQFFVWDLDTTTIGEYATMTISDAIGGYNPTIPNTSITVIGSGSTATASGYSYAEWSNVGSSVVFSTTLSSTASIGSYTISISTISALNVTSGMSVYGINVATSSTFSSTSGAIVTNCDTTSGAVTLLTSLSSTASIGTAITITPPPRSLV